MTIPLTDRAFLYGDGLFSTLRVCDGQVEGIRTHLSHLKTQCFSMNLEYPEIKEEWLRELIKLNRADKGIWRLKIILTGGDSPLLDLSKRKGRLLMQLKPYTRPCVSEMRLSLYPIPFSSPSGQFKSLSYLDRLYIADYAYREQKDDALVVSPEGYLLETAFANLFWQENESFFTSEDAFSLMKGTTLTLIEKELSIIPVKRKLDQLTDTTYIYLCNSMRGIIPVSQIGFRHFSRSLKLEEFILKVYLRALSKDILL